MSNDFGQVAGSEAFLGLAAGRMTGHSEIGPATERESVSGLPTSCQVRVCAVASVRAGLRPRHRAYVFFRTRWPPARSGFLASSLELRDQSRQAFRLFIRGEVTAGQPLNLEAEVAQSFLREIDLPVFKGSSLPPTRNGN